jgi:hypothetical protein
MGKSPDWVDRFERVFRRNKFSASIIIIVFVIGGVAYLLNSIVDIPESFSTIRSWFSGSEKGDTNHTLPQIRSADTSQNLSAVPSTTVLRPPPPRNLPKPVLKKHTVIFFSQPEGAYIYIDGRNTGHVTDTRIDLEAGVHDILFSKEGYKPDAKTINIPQDSEVISILEPK